MAKVFHFGIPYMGSKDKVARYLLHQLPPGKRFVDLFGGGFAMSHAALLSGKWESVYYNELNPLVCNLVKDAIAGKYNYKVFTPEWITRERFEAEKNKDGYIKYIWSFGNKGDSYLYSEEAKAAKKQGHDYVINGIKFDGYRVLGETPYQRRIMLRRMVKARVKYYVEKGIIPKEKKRHNEAKLELQHLQHLERLERLQHLEHLERLVINCGSYTDYKFSDGDVVYCDPPYEETAKYNNQSDFDHKAFYDWVASRDYPVFFSSYEISDKRFKMIYAKRRRGTLSATNNNDYQWERLYTNVKEFSF